MENIINALGKLVIDSADLVIDSVNGVGTMAVVGVALASKCVEDVGQIAVDCANVGIICVNEIGSAVGSLFTKDAIEEIDDTVKMCI